MPSFRFRFAKSAAVSVAAEKIGGEFFHPIGRTNGNATSLGWFGRDGNATPSLGISSIFSAIL